MLSKEEIEKARSNILRGNDIESACLIMEAVIWDGLIQVGGRVNIAKVAMRQILNFIEEYKNKGYLDVVREKIQLKVKNKQLETELDEANNIISDYIDTWRKLKEKLQEDIKKNNNFEFLPLQVEKAYNNYYKLGKIDLAQEILEIIGGENGTSK